MYEIQWRFSKALATQKVANYFGHERNTNGATDNTEAS